MYNITKPRWWISENKVTDETVFKKEENFCQ